MSIIVGSETAEKIGGDGSIGGDEKGRGTTAQRGRGRITPNNGSYNISLFLVG